MKKEYPFIKIGIYKITNKITGESYIGQSKNIHQRYIEHIHHKNTIIGNAINKYGKDNFTFEILELCDPSELDEKEDYYIQLFNSRDNGYNIVRGGQHNIGESNSRAKLSERDVYEIREAYANHERQKDVYEKYKDKIEFSTFQNLWQGRFWNNIHMDVYTTENNEYYSRNATNGELSPMASFTNEDVLNFRKRYMTESARKIYDSLNIDCNFQTFQQMLWGRTYKDIPIYDKKNKKWIN